MEEELQGGFYSSPVKRGDLVVRKAGPWSLNVQAFLRHLQRAGIDEVPEHIALKPADGTEILRFVDGEAGTYPLSSSQKSRDALVDVARVLRRIHDASVGFEPPVPSAWQYRTVIPAEVDCIGHNDLGPYNVIYRGSGVAAIIDWDFAGPSNRAWDLCYAAYRFVPLSAPRSTEAFGWRPVPNQGERLQQFLSAYGYKGSPLYLLDLLILRLASIAADIEREVALGNPEFERHRDERHTDGYREDIAYIIAQRSSWLHYLWR
jgi:Ser/Thr protein kinase RdoA (MazF antagonist)